MPADTLRVDLDEVRIVAARMTETAETAPFALSVLRIDEARRVASPALTLAGPLHGMPGIWVNDRNNFSLGERISIRGMGWRASFGVRGIYIMMDGMPLTMPDGQAVMSLIDPAFITGAELVRGPGSGFWGNAGGGTLLLSTSRFTDGTSVRSRMSVGSFGYAKGDFQASFNAGGNRYMVYGSRMGYDGFREHSRFEATRVGAHADIDTGPNSRLRLTGVFLDSPVSDNPGSLARQQAIESPGAANPANINQGAGKMTRHAQAGMEYARFFEDADLRISAYGLNRNLKNPLNFAWVQVDRIGGGGRAMFRHWLEDFEYGLGFDASFQSDSRRNWQNNGGGRGALSLNQQEQVFNTALSGRVKVPFGQFALSGGVRVDRLHFNSTDRFFADGEDNSGSREFWAVSPMAGISWQARGILTWINYSTGFETPTTTELVNRPDMTGGFNPDLNPERSHSLETGFRYRSGSGKFFADVAIFRAWVRDLLFPYRTPEGGDRDFYQNIGSTEHSGFELFMNWDPLPILSLQAGYSFSRFVFGSAVVTAQGDNVEGNRLPGIPEHRLTASTEWKYGMARLRLESEYAGSTYVNNINSEKNGSWFVMNLNASLYRVRIAGDVTASPFIQVNNLTDARYNGSVIINAFGGRFYEPAPGIHWMGGVSVMFGS